MTSVKCPQCGLIYCDTNENCRRCGLVTGDDPADQQVDQPQSYEPSPATTPFRNDSFDEEKLLHNLKRDSKLFYFIGGLQIALWFVIGNLLILDGMANIGLSFLASRFKSRIAASLLLLLTLLSVLVILVALAAGALHFNLITPIVILWRLGVSVRMVYTTFKLNAHAAVDVTRMMPPLPPSFHREEESQWSQPAGSAQWQPE